MRIYNHIAFNLAKQVLPSAKMDIVKSMSLFFQLKIDRGGATLSLIVG